MNIDFITGYLLATGVAVVWAHVHKAKPKVRRYVVTGFWQKPDKDKRHYSTKEFNIYRGDIALVIQSWIKGCVAKPDFGYDAEDFVLTSIAEIPLKEGTKYEH